MMSANPYDDEAPRHEYEYMKNIISAQFSKPTLPQVFQLRGACADQGHGAGAAHGVEGAGRVREELEELEEGQA